MTNQMLKCVVVGDGAVGKTCMIISYATNKFPQEYVPTVFDNHVLPIQINNVIHTLGIFDTSGQAAYIGLRPLAYSATDVVLICFSVIEPKSFDNAASVWLNEIRTLCPGVAGRNVPVLLIGTKNDLREDKETVNNLMERNMEPVSVESAMNFAKKIGAVNYVECSALTQIGLKNVFDEAVKAAIAPQPARKLCCTVL